MRHTQCVTVSKIVSRFEHLFLFSVFILLFFLLLSNKPRGYKMHFLMYFIAFPLNSINYPVRLFVCLSACLSVSRYFRLVWSVRLSNSSKSMSIHACMHVCINEWNEKKIVLKTGRIVFARLLTTAVMTYLHVRAIGLANLT